MEDQKVIRWTGLFGLIGAAMLVIEIPLWLLSGASPAISEEAAFAQSLAGESTIALTRIIVDMLMFMSLMVFFAGFRHLIRQANPAYEWVATLSLVAGAIWWAVSLVADGLEGGAVLDTFGGKTNPAAVRALVEGTLLIYNGAIAFAVTALFMATAGFAILGTRALPKWIGWLAWFSVATCFLAIPAVYSRTLDYYGFYNAVGWGPAVVANVPPLIWFIATSIAMIKKSYQGKEIPAAAA